MNKSILRKKGKNIEGATKANAKRRDEIIKLYRERKISNKTTAENLTKRLTSSTVIEFMTKHFKNTRTVLRNSRRDNH